METILMIAWGGDHDNIVTKWKANYKFDGTRLGKVGRHGNMYNDMVFQTV